MDYLFFSSIDFAQDESFVKWVKNPDEQTVLFWEQFLVGNPEKREAINHARELVSLATFRVYEPEPGRQDALKTRIDLSYQQWQDSRKGGVWPLTGRLVNLFSTRIGYGIAASFAGLLIAGIAFLFISQNQRITYQTNFGETLSVVLPDSSRVVLNGNSELSYPRKWDTGGTREVYMKGEAFFSVRHTPEHSRFVVHLADQLNVEVLGTEFDLVSRENKAQVVLINGQIKLTRNSQSGDESVLLAPSEMVRVAQASPLSVESSPNADRYASWKDNKLFFDQTPLSEIASLLEQTYGYQIMILDPSLNDRKFRGVFPADDVQVLINALGTYFQLNVSQTGKLIKLDSKH